MVTGDCDWAGVQKCSAQLLARGVCVCVCARVVEACVCVHTCVPSPKPSGPLSSVEGGRQLGWPSLTLASTRQRGDQSWGEQGRGLHPRASRVRVGGGALRSLKDALMLSLGLSCLAELLPAAALGRRAFVAQGPLGEECSPLLRKECPGGHQCCRSLPRPRAWPCALADSPSLLE